MHNAHIYIYTCICVHIFICNVLYYIIWLCEQTRLCLNVCVFFFRMCNVLVHAYLCIHIYTSLCTFAGVSSFCASKCSANLWICVDVHSFTIFLNCETSLSVRPCIFFHIYIHKLWETHCCSSWFGNPPAKRSVEKQSDALFQTKVSCQSENM